MNSLSFSQVTARETLSVAMLTATASVQITVLNVNDHPPLFQGPPIYKYSIMENSGAALQTTSDGLTTTITVGLLTVCLSLLDSQLLRSSLETV